MANPLAMMVECEGCQHKFGISSGESSEITHKKEYSVNGRSIFLTYYDCPNCGRRHVVQIDDQKSLQMLRENQKTFVRLAKKRSDDRPIAQKQSDKYKKQRHNLLEYRTSLMKEFTGTILHDSETDASFELRFSV